MTRRLSLVSSALSLGAISVVGCAAIAGLGDAPIVPTEGGSDAGAPLVDADHGAQDAGLEASASDDASSPQDASDAQPLSDDAPSNGPPASCLDVLNANPGAASGVYTLTIGGVAIEAYCDMTLADGGWTAFFAGQIGSPNVFAHFEDQLPDGGPMDTCPVPDRECLRHIPATVTTANQLAAICGGAAVAFRPIGEGIAYFNAGTESDWVELDDAVALTAGANAAYATRLWTGTAANVNQGWIISNDDADPLATPHTFASSYDWRQDTSWDYCNGADYVGADAAAMPVVMLLYR